MTISIRNSSSKSKNWRVKGMKARKGENNIDWLKRVRPDRPERGGLILLGGTSVAHFRIRCAQAQLRRDVKPSLWSQVGILIDANKFVSVPLSLQENNADVPYNNGTQICSLKDYADAEDFPNIAIIEFTESYKAITDNIERIKSQRSVVDIPSLIVSWLGYIWGAGAAENPLVNGHGLPSAVFADTVFGLAGVELTPGLSSSASCPEAIWVSANWWYDFYDAATQPENQATLTKTESGAERDPAEEDEQAQSFVGAKPIIPRGFFAYRQVAAAVRDKP